jgi:predicted PurR-regulated permease PerM
MLPDGAADMPSGDRPALALELPWRTIARVLATLALVWVWFRIAPLFLLVLIAVLLAVTLDPLVRRLQRRRLPRWGASSLVCAALLAIVIGFIVLATTSLSSQGRLVATRMSAAGQELASRLPPSVRQAIGGSNPQETAQKEVAPFLVRATGAVVDAALVIALAFVLTLYLLIEGRRTWDWLLAFVPPSHRARVDQTAIESQRVIFGYVVGNLATSAFATAVVVVALSLMHVPAAVLLGLLAGICDFVPVLGFIVSAIPAVILALAVSPVVAISVAAVFVAYHAAENYFIGPWVYGDRLRLSNTAVVLAFAVGASLAGVVGALIALPIAAIYPAVERIWLAERLGPRVVKEHSRVSKNR